MTGSRKPHPTSAKPGSSSSSAPSSAELFTFPVRRFDPLAPFVTLGMDSLTAMELRSRVQAALGTSVPTTLFFTHPNAATLARGLLELWLETRADPTKRHAPIPQAPREGGLTLSHAQEQLWFLHELLPSSSAYNVALRVDVHGALDPATLKASFDHIVARHESLRTTFRSEMGVPRAEIATTLDVELPVHDVKDETKRWPGLATTPTPPSMSRRVPCSARECSVSTRRVTCCS